MLFSWREAVYAFRVLCKQPLVSGLAVVSVAFGIGVNSVFFGLIDLVMLRPVPVSHPEELVRVSSISPTGTVGDDRLLLSMFQALRAGNHVFAGMFAWNDDALRNMQVGNSRFLGEVDEVSGDFFPTLGEQPLLGRWINNADVDLGSGRSALVAVLSYRCWKEHYHSDQQILGRTIIVDDVPLIIVGVTKPNFSEIDMDVTSDAIVPIGFAQTGSKGGWYNVTSRLKPNVSLNQARAELAILWPGILARTAQPTMSPESRRRYFSRRIELTSQLRGDSSLREKYSEPLLMLMSLAGMILLITCVNLACMTLGRTLSRSPEFQVRLALGASRWQILRLVLLEAVLISFAGSVIGAAAAFWSTRLLINLFWTGFVSPGLRMTMDTRVLVFMVGATFLTAILFGLAPAIRVTVVSPSAVSQYHSGTAIGRYKIGKGLITIQVSLAFVLVTAALLFATTLHGLRSVDLGYDRSNVLVMTLFRQSQRGQIPNTTNYYHQLAIQLLKNPSTESVSYSQSGPAFNFEIPTSVSAAGVTVSALSDSVGPEFFHLLRVPLLAGREFGWQDDEMAPRVGILSDSLASRLFPHEDPIGRKVDFGQNASGQGLTIVGVVRDAGFWKPQTQHPMAIYLPLMQACSGCSPLALIRTGANPMLIAHVSEHTVQAMGYQYSVRTQSLEDRFNKMLVVQRLSSWLSVAFGGAALLLTCLGLYGLISYVVHMRYREIGLRVAVGATRANVIFLVLCDALLVVVTGMLLGVAIGWPGSLVLANKYANISHNVFSGMLCASLILLVTTFLAGYLPALGASRVDPASVLRSE
ncbi:MAG TPA: ADOP family duplicated permease [Terriglobales bacterium]|nr:ADOP family duplicated permease [Terriglobales bacterium]